MTEFKESAYQGYEVSIQSNGKEFLLQFLLRTADTRETDHPQVPDLVLTREGLQGLVAQIQEALDAPPPQPDSQSS